MSHPFLLIDIFMPLPLLLRPILGDAIPAHRPPGSQFSQESLHCAIAEAVSAQIVSACCVGDTVYPERYAELSTLPSTGWWLNNCPVNKGSGSVFLLELLAVTMTIKLGPSCPRKKKSLCMQNSIKWGHLGQMKCTCCLELSSVLSAAIA